MKKVPNLQDLYNLIKEETETKSLSDILELIEDRYDIRFSYADDTILNKTAIVPKTGLPLQQVLLSTFFLGPFILTMYLHSRELCLGHCRIP